MLYADLTCFLFNSNVQSLERTVPATDEEKGVDDESSQRVRVRFG